MGNSSSINVIKKFEFENGAFLKGSPDDLVNEVWTNFHRAKDDGPLTPKEQENFWAKAKKHADIRSYNITPQWKAFVQQEKKEWTVAGVQAAKARQEQEEKERVEKQIAHLRSHLCAEDFESPDNPAEWLRTVWHWPHPPPHTHTHIHREAHT